MSRTLGVAYVGSRSRRYYDFAAVDSKSCSKSVSRVSHGLVGGELGNGRQFRGKVVRANLGQEPKLGSNSLGLVGRQHEGPQIEIITGSSWFSKELQNKC